MKFEETQIRTAMDRRLGAIRSDAAHQSRIWQSIEQEEQKHMKKKLTLIAAVALCVLLIGTVAFAAMTGRLANWFSGEDGRTNEEISGMIQPVQAVYDGGVVRVSVNEAIYDEAGKSYALYWTMENLTGEEGLYVLSDYPTFGGEAAYYRLLSNVTEFFLDEKLTECVAIGELPEGSSRDCELNFTILRAIGPYEIAEDGCIESPLAPLGEAGEDGEDYVGRLVGGGSFEVAEAFKLSFEVGETDTSFLRVPAGETDFVFDGYEIRIQRALLTPASALIDILYITDEPVTDGGKGNGPLYSFDITVDNEKHWCGSGSALIGEAKQMEDGRWSQLYEFDAKQLFVTPDALRITLVTYEDDDIFKPIYHSGESIELRFE